MVFDEAHFYAMRLSLVDTMMSNNTPDVLGYTERCSGQIDF